MCVTGHQVVMQLLSRRGIYVTESSDVAVTDTMLKQHKPVHLVSGHVTADRVTNVELETVAGVEL